MAAMQRYIVPVNVTDRLWWFCHRPNCHRSCLCPDRWPFSRCFSVRMVMHAACVHRSIVPAKLKWVVSSVAMWSMSDAVAWGYCSGYADHCFDLMEWPHRMPSPDPTVDCTVQSDDSNRPNPSFRHRWCHYFSVRATVTLANDRNNDRIRLDAVPPMPIVHWRDWSLALGDSWRPPPLDYAARTGDVVDTDHVDTGKAKDAAVDELAVLPKCSAMDMILHRCRHLWGCPLAERHRPYCRPHFPNNLNRCHHAPNRPAHDAVVSVSAKPLHYGIGRHQWQNDWTMLLIENNKKKKNN